MSLTTTLHIVQDLATPHNNCLVRAMRAGGGPRVVTWYAARSAEALPWKQELAEADDNYYIDNWRDRLRLLWNAVRSSRNRFLVVGYANWGTRVLLLVFWILRRRFMFWTDNPQNESRTWGRSALRKLAWLIVQDLACPLFVVGRHTLERFRKEGFDDARLVNLPIFIDVPPLEPQKSEARSAVRQRYRIKSDQVLFVAASRLVESKGYDLLLRAVSEIDADRWRGLKLLIVGHGPEKPRLLAIIEQCHLQEKVVMEEWLEPEAYQEVMAAADVFVHPARFDAFGGGTLYAMAMGVPVIGSKGAGTVQERIRPEVNGLVYSPEDVPALTRCIVRMLENREEREALGRAARRTAEEWAPQMGRRIVLDSLGRPGVKEDFHCRREKSTSP